MRETKFSKDPKIRVISIEEYLKSCNYFADDNLNLWKEFEKPNYGRYYKITPEYLLLINYTYAAVNFGLDLAEKLESVLIAIRDGKTEYEMLEIKKKELLEKKKRQRKIKKIEEQIINIEKGEKIPSQNSLPLTNKFDWVSCGGELVPKTNLCCFNKTNFNWESLSIRD